MSSRRRRLILFRATAECLNRGTMRPMRRPFQHPSCRARENAVTRISICGVQIRFPLRAMRCNSAPRVMRASRGNLNNLLGVLCSRVFIWNAHRQLLPPLLATASQCSTSPFCFHTSTKSMRLEPPCITWTIGWLSHELTPKAV